MTLKKNIQTVRVLTEEKIQNRLAGQVRRQKVAELNAEQNLAAAFAASTYIGKINRQRRQTH